MSNKFLLEIGTEEIPARLVGSALKQIKDNFEKTFKEERIAVEKVEVYSTPRRLVFLAEGIVDRQEDLEEMVKGPSKKIGYDGEDNPTRALMGFAKGQGVDISQIVIKEFKGEEYTYAHKIIKGKSVKEVLENKIPSIIKSINFPKSMRWGGKNLRFARPIRWIIALYNKDIMKFELEGIQASNITKGHRFLGSGNIEINNIEEYFDKLKENYVIVDQNERKQIINRECFKLAKEKGGNLLLDEDLLDELTNIVEYPTPFIGRIKEEYLKLPKDVIITPMKEHQRYIPIGDDNDKLMPYFIAVRNGNEEYIDIVAKGNEKVLDARLEDAKFFFEEDIKKPLEEYVEKLKNIVFQQKLGTVYEKTNRIMKLGGQLGEYLEVGDKTIQNIQRAAFLSKADLVTNMVSEFTELQGIIGQEYADIAGENETVSLAIFEHYLPRSADDQLPTTTTGVVVSVADKLDSITGSFAIGLQPTGSQDPYGLRRQTLGIINIILDKGLHLSLREIISKSLIIYSEESELEFEHDKVNKEVVDFFKTRLRNILIEKGIRYDVVDSILTTDNDDITDILTRAEKINAWTKKEGLNEILTAFNRVVKLSEKAVTVEIDEELLVNQEEKNLYSTFNIIKEKVDILLAQKEYDKALEQFSTLRETIDEFFDNIMVMVDDERLRNNRLALIKKISETMLTICDLSKIVS